MKKYCMLSAMALLLAGCSVNDNIYDSQMAEEEAKKNFPIQDINPQQSWNMTSNRSLDVSIKENTGKTYTIKVYNGYPLGNDGATLLAKSEVTDGKSLTIKFDAPTVLDRIYVMCQLTPTNYVLKAIGLEDDKFSVLFGEATRASRSVARSISVDDKYTSFDVASATKLSSADDLKKLSKSGSYYIEDNINTNNSIDIKDNVHLYITGTLTINDKLAIHQKSSSLSVLSGGTLTVNDDLDIQGSDKESEEVIFYNNGTVNVEDVTLQKCILINDGNFTSNVSKTFKIGHNTKVQNNCRFIIGGTLDNILEIGSAAGNETATFNNQGYVKVSGNSIWHKGATINLAGNGVFDITKTLIFGNVNVNVENNVEVNGLGERTLICANNLDVENGHKKITTTGDVKFSVNNTPTGDNTELNDLKFIKATLSTDNNECTRNYVVEGETGEDDRVAVSTYGFEDTVGSSTDYDFNDVVFQVSNFVEGKISVTLIAVGATNHITSEYSLDGKNFYPMTFNGKSELHEAFGKSTEEMINTDKAAITTTDDASLHYVIKDIENGYSFAENGVIRIIVKGSRKIDSKDNKYIGSVPYCLCVPIAWSYPLERQRIDNKYPAFGEWGSGMISLNWYE